MQTQRVITTPGRLLYIPKWLFAVLLIMTVLVVSLMVALNSDKSEPVNAVDGTQTNLVSGVQRQSLSQPIVAQVQANRLPAAQIERTTKFLEEHYFQKTYGVPETYLFVRTSASAKADAAIARCYTAVGDTIKTKLPRTKGAPLGASWTGMIRHIQTQQMTVGQATFLVLFDSGRNQFNPELDKYRIRFSIETTVRGRFADEKPFISSFVSCKRVG